MPPGSSRSWSTGRGTITVDDVLASPLVSSPFNILDCCPQSDGAAAVVLCRSDLARQFTDKPVYIAGVGLATEPLYYGEKQVMTGWAATTAASRRAYAMAGASPSDIDVAECNEAFASVPMAWLAEIDFPHERFNPNGGGISLGHPIGATGARIMTTMLHELERTGGRYGLLTMCEGGGLANATIIERLG